MSRIQAMFTRLHERGERALIPYHMVGFPSMEETLPLLRAISDAGADLIELGVPFSDPLADGPIIQEAGQIALRNGVTVEKCLETVAEMRRSGHTTPLVLMGYCNPFLAYGLERFMERAAAVGVDGLIVPDLPPEQAGPWLTLTRAHNLDLIASLAPTTPESRLHTVVRQASGFIYCIAVTGVTGMRDTLASDLPEFLDRVRALTNVPLAVGFGISTPQHVSQVAEIADGAIVGSALVNVIKQHSASERIAAVQTFIAQLKAATRSE